MFVNKINCEVIETNQNNERGLNIQTELEKMLSQYTFNKNAELLGGKIELVYNEGIPKIKVYISRIADINRGTAHNLNIEQSNKYFHVGYLDTDDSKKVFQFYQNEEITKYYITIKVIKTTDNVFHLSCEIAFHNDNKNERNDNKVIKAKRDKTIINKSINKWWILFAVFLIAICIILFILLINESIQKNNMERNYKSELQKKDNDIAYKQEKINQLCSEVDELKEEPQKLKIKKDIEELKKEVTELTTNKQSLESEKGTLESQIETLKGDVIKIKGEAKTYPAGQLTAGTDIPIGKYKVYGGSSNFVVRSSYGDLKVNIILGTGYGEVNEYIYTFKQGDKVDAHSSFKLVNVE